MCNARSARYSSHLTGTQDWLLVPDSFKLHRGSSNILMTLNGRQEDCAGGGAASTLSVKCCVSTAGK